MTNSTLGETQTNNPLLVRRKLKADFINNTTTATIGGAVVQEKQALSKVLKARADN
jgi:acyl-CoA hydrolase